MDLLEEELDSDDPVHSLHGELSGDQLLYQQYQLLFPYHGKISWFVTICDIWFSFSYTFWGGLFCDEKCTEMVSSDKCQCLRQ
jgi:hypothetical protein